MKIGKDKYLCGFCNLVIHHVKVTAGEPKGSQTRGGISKGKKRVSNALVCPNCYRFVKQR